MSRGIPPKTSVSVTQEERLLRRTDRGKLLFTVYKKRRCALYIQNNRLLAASFFSDRPSRIDAVYVGKIKNIAKNIDAGFVEIADGEICFLSLRGMLVPYLLNRAYDGHLREGDELLVQVTKDSHSTKKACVTTQVSLYNDYFVLSVGSERACFSGKLDSERKKDLKRLLTEKKILKNGTSALDMAAVLSLCGNAEQKKSMQEDFRLPPIGCVVRTRAGEESESVLLSQFSSLAESLLNLLYTARFRNCFSCLKEAPLEFEAVFQHFPLNEVTNDHTPQHGQAPQHGQIPQHGQAPQHGQILQLTKTSGEPDPLEYPERNIKLNAKKTETANWEIVTDQLSMREPLERYCREHEIDVSVRLYQDDTLSLSVLYSIESKLETALASRIWLKSGGYLVIEPTEALTVIDVNTGKYEAGKEPQETYRRINLEAAEEVAIQLRLRNLSGIIVVDFINMQASYNRELLEYLRALVQKDKIQTDVVDMTPLGLVEITRKKMSRPLREQFRMGQAE